MKEVFTDMDSKDIKSEYLNGVYNEISVLLGIEAALTLHSEFRGQQITFPVNFFSNEFISSRIAAEYDGSNIKHLATKYGYSEKWVRKIVNDGKK